eukprot:4064634-Prymnesium_polylepis.1
MPAKTGDGKRAAEVWGIICEKSNSGPINAIHPGCDTTAELIHSDEPAFLRAIAQEGEAFVDSMDEGALPDAFVA